MISSLFVAGRRHLRRAVRCVPVVAILFVIACSSESARDRPANSSAGTGAGDLGPPRTDASVMGPTGGGVISVPDASRLDVATRVMDSAGVTNDSRPEVGPGVCVPDAGPLGPGPFVRKCAAATDNECDTASDINPQLKNGPFGNGYDDDCDGKVDEGCACDAAHPVGTTKVCSLVSGTQVDPATKKPRGWCSTNSVGTETCVASGKEVLTAIWDGECRGAQPPFADDVCAAGDFDCDGRDLNSRTQDCGCKIDVTCPADPIVTKPFPDPNNLPAIDGSGWVAGGAANARNWKWTVTGGDCDNILPHPTFAIYPGSVAAPGSPRLSSDTPQTGLGTNANQRGFVVGPAANVGSTIYPAFGLSGDYLVKGEWDTSDGHHSCTVKVQVRAPGLRVELCWAPMPNDIDLHVARLQSTKACTHGWFETCGKGADMDDCYFDPVSACGVYPNNPSAWGYPRSPDTACHGWASNRALTAPCDNPRLDLDDVHCDPQDPDPMHSAHIFAFCSPENINIDNPKDGDKFAIGVQYYVSADSPDSPVHPHVNVYCNGERKLAFGYDPTSTRPSSFPTLKFSGTNVGGDLWEVGVVETKVNAGMLTDCLITPVRSRVPKPDKDGSTDVCVDTNPRNGPLQALGQNQWNFQASGAYPTTADALCWH